MFNIFNHYWRVAGNDSQVWSSAGNAFVNITDATYLAWLAEGNGATPMATVGRAMGVVIQQKGLLDASDVTMNRIVEAVALGSNSWTNTDVVAFVDYRRALRAIISGTDTTSTSIPSKPAYPAGT